MGKLKLKISFDGHNYYGWQKQNQNLPTVQDKVELALAQIFKTQVKTIGSGRTDTGVHSLCHYVVLTPPFEIESSALTRALNSNLPQDIRVLDCVRVSDGFRPTNDAKSREYRYLFTNLEIPTPFQKNYISNISYSLDFDKMHKACRLFIGTHNFQNFCCVGSEPKSTIRTVFECELLKAEIDFHGILPSHYYIRIVGDGFLKQMVRLMVGAIWDVGRGKIEPDDIQKSLQSEGFEHIAPVAPAHGLYKYSVQY